MKKLTCSELIVLLSNNKLSEYFDVASQSERLAKLALAFIELYGDSEINVYSVPGRTEIGGNHTDHQHGCVLAAAINLDILAIAAATNNEYINIKSTDFPMCCINLSSTEVVSKEIGKSASLVRGIAHNFKKRGYCFGGFNAVTDSNVLKGSGLSSSAAFEVLCGFILSDMYNNNSINLVEIAKISQIAENTHFGKPCGLMDQIACAVGGFVSIDFVDVTAPIINKIDFDFSSTEYSLCIIDTNADHSDLTDEYAAITNEMACISRYFGKRYLREVDEGNFFANWSELRKSAGDRAVLRAAHFYEENKNATAQAIALKNNDINKFLYLINKSGQSSFMYLQNVFVPGSKKQELAIALCLSQSILGGRGAFRVHGGGFGGTIQAFVPIDLIDKYIYEMNNVFGKNAAKPLSVRGTGAVKLI